MDLLNLKKDEYKEIKIGKDIAKEDFFEKYPTVKTVPFIILNETTRIGGFTDLQVYYNLKENPVLPTGLQEGKPHVYKR